MMVRYFPAWLRRPCASFAPTTALAACVLILLILLLNRSAKKIDLPEEYVQSVRSLQDDLQQRQKMKQQQRQTHSREQQKEQEIRDEQHLAQQLEQQQREEKQRQEQQQKEKQHLQRERQGHQEENDEKQNGRILVNLNDGRVPSRKPNASSVIVASEQKLSGTKIVVVAKKVAVATTKIAVASKKVAVAATKIAVAVAKEAPREPEVMRLPRKPSSRKNTRKVCGMATLCPTGQVGYSVASGGSKTDHPVICVDGVEVLSAAKSNSGRGINVAVFDTAKERVTQTKTFDTYSESDTLNIFLQNTIQDDKILLFATFDDATNALKDVPKNWIKKFGGKQIADLKFRGSWVMVGQRGLDTAHEALLNPAKTPEFASFARIQGCFKTPEIGPLHVVGIPDDIQGYIEKGTLQKNCGLKVDCPSGEFPLYLSAGKENKEYPRICYDGVYYMEKGVNDAGRGLNVIVIDGKTKKVTRRGNFDTYSEDSTQFEIFAGVIDDGDIVILVTFDDATTNLGPLAKKLLAVALGGKRVEEFAAKFRAAYYLVAKKGVGVLAENVATPVGREYPQPLQFSGCVAF